MARREYGTVRVGDRVRVPTMPPDKWFTVTAVGRTAFLATTEDDPDHESTWILADAWQIAPPA